MVIQSARETATSGPGNRRPRHTAPAIATRCSGPDHPAQDRRRGRLDFATYGLGLAAVFKTANQLQNATISVQRVGSPRA
jgi:hypothetical protein